jgi:membrane associated rhomboid family serine protease
MEIFVGKMVVAWEIVCHPVSSASILLLVWVWVKVYVEEWDYRDLCLSFSDCIERQHYWRLLTAPATHRSFLHLLLNLMMIWSCKVAEEFYGSWFVLRYSLVMVLAEALLTFALIHYSVKLGRGEIMRHILYNLQSSGCSGVLMGWLAFMSTDHRARPILFLGLTPFHPAIAILPSIAANYLFVPMSNVYSNLCGLLSGYFLASGLLQVLPNAYWSACFLFNLLLLYNTSPESTISSSESTLQESSVMVEGIAISSSIEAGRGRASLFSSDSGEDGNEDVENRLTDVERGNSSVDVREMLSQRIASLFRPSRTTTTGRDDDGSFEPLLTHPPV